MRASIESTDVITTVDGVVCRAWKGTTEAGVPFVAFINRLALEEPHDDSEFVALVARVAPRELVVSDVLTAFSLRQL